MFRILRLAFGVSIVQLIGCGGISGEVSIHATGGSDGLRTEIPQGGAVGATNQSTGNSGNVETTTGGASTVGTISTTPECSVPGCCAPLAFDPSRSRAYVVNGQLALHLVVKAADGSTAPVLFDAQVSTSAGGTQTCVGSNSGNDYGFGYVECPAVAATNLACGAAISVQVRLHGAQTDSVTLDPLCDQVEFGPSITWDTTVACPACPSNYISYSADCDHPSISNCGNTIALDYTHCGNSTFLPCRCTTYSDASRHWNCMVC